jgi:CMP-N-acetylneuraminic acid synthetase
MEVNMKDLGKVVIHIPARAGSKRVKTKNLRYIAGEPLLAYTVKAALQSKYKDQVYVNTESGVIAALAKELGARIYQRPADLASDTATSDQYNMNIIDTLKPGTLVQINPVCPLLEAADIETIIDAYQDSDADTLITTTTTQMQCFYREEPINIDPGSQLAPTQQNDPVHICNWAVSIWDAQKFKERFNNKGFAVFGETRMLYPIHPLKAIKISTEEDFDFAEFLLEWLKTKKTIKKPAAKYWEI